MNNEIASSRISEREVADSWYVRHNESAVKANNECLGGELLPFVYAPLLKCSCMGSVL